MSGLVSVQIIHHENDSQKYLDWAIKSVAAQTYKDVEVLVMDSTVNGAKVPEWVRHVRTDRQMTGPQATKLGTIVAHKDTKYHLLCNDDVIMNKHAIEEMVFTAGDDPVVVNPFSNCDLGWLYWVPIELTNGSGGHFKVTERFNDYEDIKGYEHSIITYPKPSRVYLTQQQHCMYATLVPKRVWDDLGGYDENLLMGYSDTDFCIRARHAGAQLVTAMSAFIWHYGGATTKHKPRVRQEKDREYFKKKWNLPDDFDGKVA